MDLLKEELELLRKIRDNEELPANADLSRLHRDYIKVLDTYSNGTITYALTPLGEQALKDSQ